MRRESGPARIIDDRCSTPSVVSSASLEKLRVMRRINVELALKRNVRLTPSWIFAPRTRVSAVTRRMNLDFEDAKLTELNTLACSPAIRDPVQYGPHGPVDVATRDARKTRAQGFHQLRHQHGKTRNDQHIAPARTVGKGADAPVS